MAKGRLFKNKVIMQSHAKINLSLDVLGKNADGYHNLRMIMQTVSLCDDISVTSTARHGKISISCNNYYIPRNEKNIAYKAAALIFKKYFSATAGCGVDIKINKRIPISAGLAGGSGNAAAVIKAMNQLFNLCLSDKEMCGLGVQIGADVPYCIYGGTMLSEGIGEILTPLPAFPNATFLLVNSGKPLSTAKVFSSIEDINKLPHTDTDRLIELLHTRNIEEFMNHTGNSLEVPAMEKMPEILSIKTTLKEKGAIGSLMSGSGPTVFGLFKNDDEAKLAYEFFKRKKYKVFITTPV